tara:strand:+ start:885 stop:1055 length:171 start_codon:yes stop_codon:yes gene_type:complete
MDLKKINFVMSDSEHQIKTEVVKAKSFTGVDRKYKDQDLIAVIKIDDNKFVAFVEE